jgi:hypothetical protein
MDEGETKAVENNNTVVCGVTAMVDVLFFQKSKGEESNARDGARL